MVRRQGRAAVQMPLSGGRPRESPLLRIRTTALAHKRRLFIREHAPRVCLQLLRCLNACPTALADEDGLAAPPAPMFQTRLPGRC